MAVPRDNVRELRIGENTYNLEASLGTATVYRNEFFGKLDAPYKGLLADDMLQAYHKAQPFEEGDDGKLAENPDYMGYDVDALLRVAWAMARSVDPNYAKPYKYGYKRFYNEVIHQPAGVFEEASLYNTVVMQLGGGIIFRRPEGLAGADEPDEAQEKPEG